MKLTRSLMDKDTGFVTVLYGEDIEEDRAAQLEVRCVKSCRTTWSFPFWMADSRSITSSFPWNDF